MALTATRPGQANISGDELALFLEVFSGEVLAAFLRKVQTEGRVISRQITEGKSAQFPIVGPVGRNFHTPGNIIDTSVVSHAARTIAIDGLLVAPVFLDILDEVMNHFDLRSVYAEQSASGLANEADQRNLRSFVAAAREATHPNTALPGGTRITDVNMDTDADVLKAAVFSAAQALDENDVPEDRRSLYVRPAQFYLLLADGEFVDRDFAGEGSKARAMIPFASDLEVVKSNNTPQADDSANADLPADLQLDYSASIAVASHWTAAGTVTIMDVTSEAEFIIERQGFLLNSKAASGHNWLRPDGAVELATA